MQSLHERIKQIRGDISREEFSQRVGISHRALITYEQNERTPKADVIKRICAETQVAPRWILMGDGPMYEEHLSPSSGSDNENVRQSDTLKVQHTEIIGLEKNKKSDSRTFSENTVLQQENTALNKELRDLMRENSTILRENGDLRVDVERKKARIVELERELARVLKGEEAFPLAGAG